MDSKNFVLLLLAAAAVGVVLVALATADFQQVGRGLAAFSQPQCVGVLRLDGEIDGAPQGRFFQRKSAAEEFEEALSRADADASIGSVLLAVNSPGGSAVASKELFDAVNETTKKPVVAYLGEVAASGGYYAASASDYIVANPNTLTGSIGARATLFNYQELFTKLGLRVDALTTGEFKDVGEGYRNLTEEERAILQAVLEESASNFVGDVLEVRGEKIDSEKIGDVLDGRVLSATQALEAGLVDEIGSRKTALRKAAALGNVSVGEDGLPQACELGEKRGLGALLSELSAGFARGLAQGLREPRVSLRYEA